VFPVGLGVLLSYTYLTIRQSFFEHIWPGSDLGGPSLATPRPQARRMRYGAHPSPDPIPGEAAASSRISLP
jgi:hypothetical protein